MDIPHPSQGGCGFSQEWIHPHQSLKLVISKWPQNGDNSSTPFVNPSFPPDTGNWFMHTCGIHLESLMLLYELVWSAALFQGSSNSHILISITNCSWEEICLISFRWSATEKEASHRSSLSPHHAVMNLLPSAEQPVLLFGDGHCQWVTRGKNSNCGWAYFKYY